MTRLAGKDVCVNVVGSLQEAMADPQFRDRGLFSRSVIGADDDALPAVCRPDLRAAAGSTHGAQVSAAGRGQ